MTAVGELDRLNRLGRDASGRALRYNTAINLSDGDYIDVAHSVQGLDHRSTPVTGRIALTFFLVLALSIAFSEFGLPYPGGIALVMIVLGELAWFFYKRRRLAALQKKSGTLQARLHDLKQQQFALRYEEAKLNGALHRWEKKT